MVLGNVKIVVNRLQCRFVSSGARLKPRKKMQLLLVYSLVAIACLGLTHGQKLPDYIVPCARSKPDFHQCCIENAKKAVPRLLKGDRRFKIPPLAPLKLQKVAIEPNNNLKITLTDLEVRGLETTKVEDVMFDFNENKIKVSLFMDYLNVLSQYEIDGRLLVPIRGSGPLNITTVRAHVEYVVDIGIEKKGGKEYMKIEKDHLTLKNEEVHYQLDNLFGNKELSDETNKILNENSNEVGKELNGPISETIRSVVTSLIKNIITQFPLEEVFLD